MEGEVLTIRELKARANSSPLEALTRGQVESVQVRQTKAGREFLEIRVGDGCDAFVWRVWGDAECHAAASRLMARAFVEIGGAWTQGGYGLEVRARTVRELQATELEELLRGPAPLRERQERDFLFIEERCAGLADPRLAALTGAFLRDFGERLRRCAAARDYHHARRGGLVEHVAQMMRCAEGVAAAYPQLNRDLLLAGVLFHDCGKLWENCYAPDAFLMTHSERGELLGHITIGIELINRLWRQLAEENAEAWASLQPASESVRLHLLHLIASHHGELEFGSPVVPKTPEAIALHHVDNIDAKLEMMAEAYATSARLTPNIFERRRPLPGNSVRPLPHFGQPDSGSPGEDPE